MARSNRQTEAIFQRGAGRAREGGGGCRRIKALSFFSQICVNVKSSEACEPIRPTLRFMVHDIGQIYAKPHARLKETVHSLEADCTVVVVLRSWFLSSVSLSSSFFFFSSAGRLHNALLMVFTPLTLFPGLQRLPSLI